MPAPTSLPDPADASGPLLLSAAEIRALMRPADWIAAAEAAFRGLGGGRATAPAPMHLPFPGGGFHAKAGALQGEPFFALKLNGNFPGNRERGLPTIHGVLLLCSAEDGRVLAVMDSATLTLQRTAAAAALAATLLARPDSTTLTLCGCGAQGAATLAMLAAVLPLRRAWLWDRDPDRAAALARAAPLEAAPVSDLASATRESDVVVAATTAERAYLTPEHVAAGASSRRSARTARASRRSRPSSWPPRAWSPTSPASAPRWETSGSPLNSACSRTPTAASNSAPSSPTAPPADDRPRRSSSSTPRESACRTSPRRSPYTGDARAGRCAGSSVLAPRRRSG